MFPRFKGFDNNLFITVYTANRKLGMHGSYKVNTFIT